MKIQWTEPSIFDLESIRDYIARDSEYYASEFVGKIIDIVEKLNDLPLMGRKVPEANDDKIREIIFHSYRIIYKFDNTDKLIILGVIHAARDMINQNLRPWEVI